MTNKLPNLSNMNEQPIVEKSKLGDLWKVTYEDKTIFMNQSGVEKFLTKFNERPK